MVTLFHIVSADGYIARKDGSEDFIPDGLWNEFLKYCVENDAIVWGKNTYEKALRYSDELLKPFEALPAKKIILTKDLDFKVKPGYIVMHSPEEAVSLAANTLASTGPAITDVLFKAKLIDRVVTIVLPQSIGEGIKQFDFDTTDILALESEETLGTGEKVRIYSVSK